MCAPLASVDDTIDNTPPAFVAQVLSTLPPVGKPGLSDTAKIGIGVGAGVGGAAVVAGLVGVGLSRKRRMAVEPRDRLSNAEAGYGGR